MAHKLTLSDESLISNGKSMDMNDLILASGTGTFKDVNNNTVLELNNNRTIDQLPSRKEVADYVIQSIGAGPTETYVNSYITNPQGVYLADMNHTINMSTIGTGSTSTRVYVKVIFDGVTTTIKNGDYLTQNSFNINIPASDVDGHIEFQWYEFDTTNGSSEIKTYRAKIAKSTADLNSKILYYTTSDMTTGFSIKLGVVAINDELVPVNYKNVLIDGAPLNDTSIPVVLDNTYSYPGDRYTAILDYETGVSTTFEASGYTQGARYNYVEGSGLTSLDELYLDVNRTVSDEVVVPGEPLITATDGYAYERRSSLLDIYNYSTTTKVYFDNSKVAIRPGDKFSTETGEVFTVDSVGHGTETKEILTDAVKVAKGDGHIVVLLANGTVWGGGDNTQYQLGDLLPQDGISVWSRITDKNVIDIACGKNHTIILTDEGKMYSTGNNSLGQLARGNTDVANGWVRSGIGKAAKVYAYGDGNRSLHIDLDGKVWTVGDNEYGQSAMGDLPSKDIWHDTGITAIDVDLGFRHTMCIKPNNEVWGTGWNDYYQLGDGTTTTRKTWVRSGTRYGVKVGAGTAHSMVLSDDGKIAVTGYSPYGGLGLGTTTAVNNWTEVPNIFGKDIYAEDLISAVIATDNTISLTGINDRGQLGLGHTNDVNTFTKSNITGVSYMTTLEATPGIYIISNGELIGATNGGVIHEEVFVTTVDYNEYYTEYYANLSTPLAAVPTAVYGISTYRLNDTVLTVDTTTVDAGLYGRHFNDTSITPTNSARFIVDLGKGCSLTSIGIDLHS